MRVRCAGIVFTAFMLMLTAGLLVGQGTTSSATGRVTDPTGAAIPGAVVVLTNQGTNRALTAQTTTAGIYVFDSIPVGTYTIAVSKTGFKAYSSSGNIVTIGQPTTVNVRLEVGAASQTVSVSAAAELVQTSSSGNLGNEVNQATIQQLPIVGTRGRNALNLDLYQPGVVQGGNTGGGVNVNGNRDRAWNFTLDGIGINEASAPGSNFSPVNTNPDSVSEFRVITSDFTAQYGNVSGGQVAMITRQGTNRFHGEGFEFYQTPSFNANNYFNQLDGLGRSDFVQNIYGGSIGGPIRKNRTFFFTNLQLLHAHESQVESTPVFTTSARQGLFRYVAGGRNGNAASAKPSVDAQGNVLPGVTVKTYNVAASNPQALTLDSAIQKTIAETPLPNDFSSNGDGLNLASFTWGAPETQKNVDFTTRVDEILNPQNMLFVRWYQGHQNTLGDIVNGGLPPFPGAPNVVDTYRTPKSLAVGWTSSVTPAITNQFVAGFTHFVFNFANPDPNFASNPAYTLGIVADPRQNYVGNARAINSPQVNDDLTWVHGAHTFKAGVSVQYTEHVDDRGSIGGFDAQPTIDFSTGVDPVSANAFGLPADIDPKVDLGNLKSTINVLLGRIGLMGQGFVSNANGTAYQPGGSIFNFESQFPQYEYYAQDTWHLRPNLVMDAGLRWEMLLPPQDPRHRILAPNQPFTVGSAATNSLAWAPGRPLYKSSNALLGPSIGFAWDPFGTGKTSVRAHYGIYYDPINTFSISSGVFENLVGLNFGAINTTYGQGGGLLRTGPPALSPPAGQTPVQLRQPPAFSAGQVTAIDPNWRPAEVAEWALSVQRQVVSNMVVSVNYVGNHASHLYGGYNANQVQLNSNGFLNAFNTVAAGGDSALMDQLLSADPKVPNGETGSQYVRATFGSQINLGSVGDLANRLGQIQVNGMGLPQASGLSPFFFYSLPQFAGGFFVLDSNDWSNYDALQVQLQRRMGTGLTFQAAYSFAKSRDTRSYDPTFTRVRTGNSQSASSTPFDINNRRLNYAPSDFDLRHSLQTEFVWNLPFGKGQRWGNAGGWMDRLVGGWTAANILTYTSGRPFTVYSGAFTFDGDVQSPANCSGCSGNEAHLHTDPVSGNRYIFTPQQIAQFSRPAPGALGNTGRNAFRLPNQFNTDLDLAKKVQITESDYLELRADATNLTNHPNYDLADSSTITSSVFGRMRNAVANTERRIQLGLKFYF